MPLNHEPHTGLESIVAFSRPVIPRNDYQPAGVDPGMLCDQLWGLDPAQHAGNHCRGDRFRVGRYCFFAGHILVQAGRITRNIYIIAWPPPEMLPLDPRDREQVEELRRRFQATQLELGL